MSSIITREVVSFERMEVLDKDRLEIFGGKGKFHAVSLFVRCGSFVGTGVASFYQRTGYFRISETRLPLATLRSLCSSRACRSSSHAPDAGRLGELQNNAVQPQITRNGLQPPQQSTT